MADFCAAHLYHACIAKLVRLPASCALIQGLWLQALKRRGHEVAATGWSGVSQVVVVDAEPGMLSGVADPRKDGAPFAY